MKKIMIVITMIAVLAGAIPQYAFGQAQPNISRYASLDEISRAFDSPDDLSAWLSENFKYAMKIPDRLQKPDETLRLRTGDCDDFAVLASALLNKKGIASEIVIIRFSGLNIRHALCAWKDEEGFYDFMSNTELIHTGKTTLEEAVRKYYPDYTSIEKKSVLRYAELEV